jgi:biotin carboxyl carrier protein
LLPTTAEDRSEGRTRLEVVVGGWRFEATVESAARAELRDRAAREAAAHHRAADLTLRAQIPGRVVKVWVKIGDQVEAGQRLLAVEAMKMENEIRAPNGGTIVDLRVAVGTLVERQFELLTIK